MQLTTTTDLQQYAVVCAGSSNRINMIVTECGESFFRT